jgi:integrase
MKTTILTSTQLKALYSAALKTDPQLIMPIALQAHAGLREMEISSLEYDDIDFNERCITIRPSTSKTNCGRVIKRLPEAVWSWLDYCKANDLLAVPNNWQRRRRALAEAAGIHSRRDILRLSFASHLYTLIDWPNEITSVLGWELLTINTLRMHFVAPTKQQAKAYFSVMAPPGR